MKLSSGLLVLLLLGVLVAVSATAAAENHNNLTIEDQGLEDGAVTVENVSTAQQSTIVVAYRDGDATVVAGLADADNLDGATVQVDIEDDGGFPGEHSALLFNDTDVDGVGIGDDVAQITDRALAADAALVSVDVTGDGVPARDVTGNGTLNDIDGDTDLDILDVQALFDNLDEPSVQDNAQLFDFDGDDRVSIFDVQALFTQFRTPFASLNISEQATASSTFTAENATTPGVRVTDVRSNVDSAVVVTYEQGGELVVAGLKTFEQPELAGGDVVVPVEDTVGFPGEHTAHVIPTDELSSQYEPGDTVSGATAAAVLDSEMATVFQGTVELANQTVVGAAGDGDLTVNASLAGDSNTLYAINLHEATDAGAPGSFVGATDVISGTTEGVELRLEDPSGESVTIEETGEFIAMIHIVDDDSVEEGDSFPPAAFPVLPHTDATGPVPGGVTDDAAVTVLEPANFSVSIDPPGTLVEGENLSVETTITNTGDVEATQDITFDVGSLGTNVTALTLDSGESQDVTLSVGTQSGDAGEYTATVSSANDTASANVTVLASAEFLIDITETNTPVEGEQLNVTTQVQNVGEVEAEQTISLDVGPLGNDSTSVTLSGGESQNLTLSVGTGTGDAGQYNASVSSANDTASANVTVLASAEFLIDITETNTPVEGEQLNVTTQVQNVGDVEAERTITLDVGPLGTNSTNVTLSGGALMNATLSVGTGTGDAGQYNATVSSVDDSANANVTVLAPGSFSVEITGKNTPVEGEQLNVTTTVENTGDTEDTQNITLSVDALGTNSTNVTLSGGTSTSLILSVGTEPGDAGEYTATVSSANDTASANVTVLAPAEFRVNITETNTPVEGEQLNVTAQVENVGDVEAEQTISLDVGPLGNDSTSVTLSGGASTNATLSVGTGTDDAGQYTATVSSADDTASANVTVLAPTDFRVAIVEADNVTEGEQLDVLTEVENVGDVEAEQTISLDVGPLGNDSTSVTLSGGESQNLTLSVGTADSAGEYTATVSSANDTASANVTVLASAEFLVNITETNTPVESEQLNVTAQVQNVGDAEAEQTISLDVGPLGNDSTSVTLSGGESQNLTLSVGTGTGDAGQYNAAVSSANDTASANVTVNAPARFDVTITSVNGTVTAGEAITASYEVTNTGDVQATQDIEFTVNGSVEGTEAGVTLNGSETFSGQFSYTTGSSDTPAVTVVVASADDSATETVTVNEPASFDVTITSIDSAVTEGETITVVYEVTNTGDVADTQDIDFAVNGTTEATEAGVTLNGSETFSDQFTYTTKSADTPAVSVAVSNADDSATETVTVNEPASFDVSITSVDSAVTEGETITVAYEVTNTGDVADTQDIDFAVNGTTEDTASGVTLNGSETFSDQFTYATTGGDAPAVSVAVLSADDSATETVTVNEPAVFDVTLTSVNSAVTAGETITASYEVTNTGDVQATQDIELSVNGRVEDTEADVTLSGSETFSDQFTYATGLSDTPAVTIAVASEDSAASETVTVNAPARFNVTITSVNGTVTAGETITASYEVTNTGDVQATQDIEFIVNGSLEDTESGVTLNGSETFSGQFTYTTGSNDTPAVNVTVASNDDSATASVTVLEPAFFQVSTLNPENATVDERQAFDVSATVENTGEAMSTQTVELLREPGGTEITNQTLTLAGGNTTTVTFENVTVENPGEYNHTVVTENDQVSGNLTVRDLPAGNFSVDFVGQTNETVAGEQQRFDVRVNNTGTERALQEIELDWGTGTYTASEFVALNASESTVTTFTVQTDSDEFLGRYDVEVSSLNETDTTRARINPERIIENAEVAPGGTVNVTVTGELGGTLDFTLVESYQPAVNDSEIKFEGTSFNPLFQNFTNETGIASFIEKGPGTLNITYKIVLPANASSGDEFGYDEQDTAFELGRVQFDIGGDDTITVVSGAGVRSMSFAPV